ncbi:MAG: hypothetical protein LVQ95_01625 [Candidatus Micrarchaeales archaeon]|nr:hypothetical protein [Candidatus Micrarchaeales archaeon]
MPIDPPRRKPQGQRTDYGKFILPAVGLIILIIIAYFAISFIIGVLSIVNITGATSLAITNSTTVFMMGGNEYAMHLVTSSLASSTAKVAVTRLPVFVNPTLEVSLVSNNATDINTLGNFADMQLLLTKISNNTVSITVTPVPTGLALAPTSSRITMVQSSLSPVGSSSQENATTSTTSATTTSTTGTTTAGTTTVGTSGNYSAAQSLLKTDVYYGLMNNYTKTYETAASNCNSTVYNSTYVTKYGHLPNATNSFLNITKLVPYDLNYTLGSTSASVWLATYSTYSHTPSITGGPALVVTMNLTRHQIVSSVTKGVFGGLNYSTVYSSYLSINNIHNACGVYVLSCSYPC